MTQSDQRVAIVAVALADWQAAPVEQQAQALRDRGYQALGLAADISRRAEVERMVGRAVEAFGRVDVLVNNAGINPPHQAPFLEMSDETWARTIDVNLTGMFLCSQIAGRVMAKQRAGSIVNITSIGAIRPTPGGVAYHASKGGVISFTLALAVNLAPYQIRANAIGPGYIATPMTGGMADPAGRAQTLTRVPLDRIGQPEDFSMSTAGRWHLGSGACRRWGNRAENKCQEQRTENKEQMRYNRTAVLCSRTYAKATLACGSMVLYVFCMFFFHPAG